MATQRRILLPIRPVVGKPGRFIDPRTGKKFDISQMYEGEKYDTVEVPAASLGSGTHYFFQNLSNKNIIDTNFKTQNRLDANEKMVLERIGIYVRQATGTARLASGDLLALANDTRAYFSVNGDIIKQGPLAFWPSGFGLSGSINETAGAAVSIVGIGVPSTSAVQRLRRRQMLTPEHQLEGALVYESRGWLSSYTAQTLSAHALVTMVLQGLISRPATR